MKPKDFVIQFYPYAKNTEDQKSISAIAILTQAALESGWGRFAPGNMFFGVKDHDGINGNEQLLTTTEYSKRYDLKFPEIISITPCVINGQKMFKYRVKDYFRKYATPEECFNDHANFFFMFTRYHDATIVGMDPYAFLEAIAKAGYATAPDYYQTLEPICKQIEKIVYDNKL